MKQLFPIYMFALALCACDGLSSADDSEKKQEAAKAELNFNVVETKNISVGNAIEAFTYDYFAAGDTYWMGLYESSVNQSIRMLRGITAEGLYNITGVESLGDIYDAWNRTERCEGLWNVVLSYREISVEVVNGLDVVVCRYKRKENFSRICNFIGYRQRVTMDALTRQYNYSPMSEYSVPDKCRARINTNSYYNSVEVYKNDKGQSIYANFCEYIDKDYSFDESVLDKPVSYTPPLVQQGTDGGQSGGGGSAGADDGRRPYKFVKSVDAYTVYSNGDVDKSTIYIYNGPGGNRASWVYNSGGLEMGPTETINSGSATIDGRSYSHYISSFGVPTYFNF